MKPAGQEHDRPAGGNRVSKLVRDIDQYEHIRTSGTSHLSTTAERVLERLALLERLESDIEEVQKQGSAGMEDLGTGFSNHAEAMRVKTGGKVPIMVGFLLCCCMLGLTLWLILRVS